MGSKIHICGVVVPTEQQVFVCDINGKEKLCEQWKPRPIHHKHAQCVRIESILTKEFLGVLTKKLGRVHGYVAPRMRFHAQVPSDGGKQMDFSGSAKPILQKQIEEWLAMGVIKPVNKQLTCVSPLLLIPNEKKSGFRLCQDLRMLNSVTVKEWGPAMNKHMRLKCLPISNVFSSFDLSKGFLQISIPYEDQTYFGMFLWGQFYVFTRFPFGFMNSMQFFNSALEGTMNCITQELIRRGYRSQQEHWVVQYVDDALVGSSTLTDHLQVLRIILQVLDPKCSKWKMWSI